MKRDGPEDAHRATEILSVTPGKICAGGASSTGNEVVALHHDG